MKEQIAHEQLVRARDAALAVVADMPNDPLKVPTYQTILAELVRYALSAERPARLQGSAHVNFPGRAKATGTTSRLVNLIEEGFFGQPRSLKEIRERLAESGFHYRLEDLGTPLTRLAQRKRLRRSQFSANGKGVFKYSNY